MLITRKRLKKDFKAARSEYKKLLGEESLLKEANRALNRAATDVENSYKITRKMSEALEFETLFKTFNEFLSRGAQFKECKLLLIGQENGSMYIEKTYRMKHSLESIEGEVRVLNPDLKDEIALDIFHEDQRPIFFSQSDNKEILSRFYTKQDIKTLASNPLIVEDELIGILVVEDLEEKDFDKFLILAGQFALEAKKVRLYEAIQKLAIIDGLTGVYMRRHFMERVEEEIKRAEYHKLNLSFLMIDIDHFKACNDQHGHLVGDAVLSQLAGILKKNVREIDIICRYGGEEFALALPDTSKDASLIVSERIRHTVEEFKLKAYNETLQITVSIGVSSYPADGKEMHRLLDIADKALYEAKRTGRNKVCAI